MLYEKQWEEKGIEIETVLDEEIIVEGDEELLMMVWSNLISNAVKFTERDGKISVSLTKANGRAIVTVTDNGYGMTKETADRIFEKFYQGDTSHATEGNGLGLALVKRIMDITKGEITVESEPGKGSVFTVKLNLS